LPTAVPNPRRFLSADGLIDTLRFRFNQISDSRREASVIYPLPNVLMAAFAMFSLKDPSLLAFQERINDEAIKSLYHLDAIPSDSQMRDILDPIDPELLNDCFLDIFYELQRGGVLKDFVFDDGYYLIAIDGTGHFCSTTIRCEHCLKKTPRAAKPYITTKQSLRHSCIRIVGKRSRWRSNPLSSRTAKTRMIASETPLVACSSDFACSIQN